MDLMPIPCIISVIGLGAVCSFGAPSLAIDEVAAATIADPSAKVRTNQRSL
jgi:hypothetical protein